MKIKRLLAYFLVIMMSCLFIIATPFLTPKAIALGNTSLKKGAGSVYGWPEETIRAVGISWGYDWYINQKAFLQKVYEHVPMVHPTDVPNNLTLIQNVARTYPGRYWLVFNEPDYYECDNISPAAGAEAYYQIRKAIKDADPSAKLIVGGVCMWPNPTWLAEFREEYKKKYGAYPVVEGWHIHIYVTPGNYNIDSWRSEIEFYKNWMIKNGEIVELWLTEFGCLTSETTGIKIMEDQIPWLEANPFVTRYAWFAFYLPPDSPFKGSLLLPDGQLSALGRLYATFGASSSSFTITATAGANGTISPSGVVSVSSGGSQTFTITPNAGYQIADVRVDGISQGAISSYTFRNVTAPHSIGATFAPVGATAQVVFAVNCGGGQYTDKSGIVYKGDVNFSGGQVYTTTAAIAGTNDGPLYQSERWGNFSYQIPVANGTYNVTLKFAELYCWAQECRVFSVKAEGQQVISNLDLFQKVGKNRAYDVTFPVTVADGKLTLEFYNPGGNAKVNAILVTAK